MLVTQIRRFISVRTLWLMAAALLASLAFTVQAGNPQDKADTPHEIVKLVTDDLLQVVRKYDGGEKDREAYFAEFEETLEPVVDFAYIARVVMGPQGDDATDEQIREFAQVFRRGLVRTYSRGIASYVDSDIRVVPPEQDISDERRVTVRQEVRHRGSNHRLSYTMAKNRAGEWKLINLVLDGVNLGRSFRSQFAESARKYDGDIDKVIKNWLDDV
ncbi:phospholipid-binding protein MlaC [Marinimicrobium sp. ABcell2]|uniref:MlaC/ttg2D family ABC transporter substrate-binding protein n=1 Tax=Marinimicrobium sp. ABcell2 TaxID=3069751 RepID=UPI0027B1FA1A|nr:ABC transporter substrate-binding protein [Marinimicrobium sp. ABcell2]MDQ2078267.1 ABC transporter substrate-binding protein [Marinimicrobium sp. ABcell2]